MYKDLPEILNNDGHCSLCHALLDHGDSPWSICFDPYWQHNAWGGDSYECRAILCQECAERLLSNTVIPLEPTPAMIEAGAQRLARWEDEAQWPDDWPLQDQHFRNEAERVWRSMWLAAQENSDENIHCDRE